MNNLENLSAVSNKLEAINEDSAKVEQIVKGYLRGTKQIISQGPNRTIKRKSIETRRGTQPN